MGAKTTTRTRGKPAAAALAASVMAPKPFLPKLGNMRSAANAQIGERIKLADFRASVTPLTTAERETMIAQAIEMLDQAYAHLTLKRALHANDPIQSLRLLRLRHAALDERAFQSAMMEIFLGLRDLHTNYILPGVYAGKFAFLPFRVEEFYAPGGVSDDPASQAPKYVVSWVSPVNTVKSLKEGVVVSHWNGSPIALAVARNGNREAGSNTDARRAQGVEALTLRWLGISLPPDEDWVNLTYTDGTKTFDTRFDWEVIDVSDRAKLMAGSDAASATGARIGLDLKRLLLDRARKLIFDPQAIKVENDAMARAEAAGPAAAPAPIKSNVSILPDVFPLFGEVTTPSGKFGYIRLKSFAPSTGDVDAAVNEFNRILKTLPPSGLILDVRGNGGGFINIGELILQMLTPHPITPEPFQFPTTPLTLQMASEAANGVGDWRDSIEQGLESGAGFSQGFPLTDPDGCNAIGQVYQGPVVLVTDALCYSTTDIFSAGFQDHRIGKILGCHSSTGAGGANVWAYQDLQQLQLTPSNPFGPLPGGANMRVAARRCTRVGSRSGVPVEDYGVKSDIRYLMTKTDVVGDNQDLMAAAAKILSQMPQQSLRVTAGQPAPAQKFAIDFTNVDRVDLFVDDRPAVSLAIPAGQTSQTVTLPSPAPPGSVLNAQGYRGHELVVSTRLKVVS